jgi:hypothetical protein
MVWLAPHHINWVTGHLTLEVLLRIHIERNPLQAELAAPSTITLLATGNIAAERYICQQLAAISQGESTTHITPSRLQQASRTNTLQYSLAFDNNAVTSPPSVTIQAQIIQSLTSAFHEIARAYNLYILIKLESQWSLLQKKGRAPGATHPLPSITKLGHLIKKAKAPESYIPTAYDIEQVFSEAFRLYYRTPEGQNREEGESEYSSMDEGPRRTATIRSGSSQSLRLTVDLEFQPARPQLPYWMTSRTNKPPLQDSWSLFVFDRLFKPSQDDCSRISPSWNNLDFLILYRRYKTLFHSTLRRYHLDFDKEMSRRIGYSIRLTFEGDPTKPVTFCKKQPYTDFPQFFRIKMFAPYFSNPAQQRKIALSQYQGIPTSAPARDLSDQKVSLPTPQLLCSHTKSLLMPELQQLKARLSSSLEEWSSIHRQPPSPGQAQAKRTAQLQVISHYKQLKKYIHIFFSIISSWQGQWKAKNRGLPPAEHDYSVDLLRVPNEPPRGNRPYATDSFGQHRLHILTADCPILIPPTYQDLKQTGNYLRFLLMQLPHEHVSERHMDLLNQLSRKLTPQSLGQDRLQALSTTLPALFPNHSAVPQEENLLQQFLLQTSPPERYAD